jgi:N-methylhydantoinase A
MKVIGVDVGGTFTDLIFSDLDTGAMAIHKVPTTPGDPSDGVMKGIEGLLVMAQRGVDEIDLVFHATTATNAVLEDKGAKAGMITNESFRDVLYRTPSAGGTLFDPARAALAKSSADQTS